MKTTTTDKIMWKRGEIAPEEQFHLFSTLLYIYISNFRSQITYSFVKCGCSIYCFPHSLNSDMSRYGYLEVFQWVPWNSRSRESTVLAYALLILCRMYLRIGGCVVFLVKFLCIYNLLKVLLAFGHLFRWQFLCWCKLWRILVFALLLYHPHCKKNALCTFCQVNLSVRIPGSLAWLKFLLALSLMSANSIRKFWRDCTDAQARLNLSCSHML